jgi:hypothetical protein
MDTDGECAVGAGHYLVPIRPASWRFPSQDMKPFQHEQQFYSNVGKFLLRCCRQSSDMLKSLRTMSVDPASLLLWTPCRGDAPVTSIVADGRMNDCHMICCGTVTLALTEVSC